MSETTHDDLLDQDVDAFQQLILRTTWTEQRRFAQELSYHSLTVPQFFALVAIWRHGGECPIGQLADATMQCSATMTGIIDRLTERGLVERRRDANDRRQVLVRLTERGLEALRQVQETRRQHVRQAMERIDEADRREMLRLLRLYEEATGLAEIGEE
ncbi:MAG: MarR family transcriptional regulator [Chloroflexota bacterium]|nr:MarR family transcriptional regulator [Chloroflexota bacterium]